MLSTLPCAHQVRETGSPQTQRRVFTGVVCRTDKHPLLSPRGDFELVITIFKTCVYQDVFLNRRPTQRCSRRQPLLRLRKCYDLACGGAAERQTVRRTKEARQNLLHVETVRSFGQICIIRAMNRIKDALLHHRCSSPRECCDRPL
jgi:hypothetical protein